MDGELRAHLEGMEQRLSAQTAGVRVVAEAGLQAAEAAQRSAEAAQRSADAAQRSADAAQRSADAAQNTAEAAQCSAEAAQCSAEAAKRSADAAQNTAEAARSEARVLHEDTMRAIGTVIEGVNLLRESVERRAEDRARDVMNRHIGPLTAIVQDHELRITALEKQQA